MFCSSSRIRQTSLPGTRIGGVTLRCPRTENDEMNKRLIWAVLVAGFGLQCAPQSTDLAVALDFGAQASPWPWNNCVSPASGWNQSLHTLTGLPSGITATLVHGFSDENAFGSRRTSPALGLPPSASGDSFWGNAETYKGLKNPSALLRFEGLQPGIEHEISCFGSRLTDDLGRETLFVLAGDSAVLDASNNVAKSVTLTATPGPEGVLELQLSPSPSNGSSHGFFHLGACVIRWHAAVPVSPVTGGLDVFSPRAGTRWQVGGEGVVRFCNTTGLPAVVLLRRGEDAPWEPLDTLPATADRWSGRVDAAHVSSEARIMVRAGEGGQEMTAPFVIEADASDIRPVVVIGSSTAAGAGASVADSAWVSRFREAVGGEDHRWVVVNLARGGYTTRHLLPEGEEVDTLRNIAMALSLNPAAVVVNLPSNDAARRMPFEETWVNFERIAAAAESAGVPLWVATTQPRNGFDAAQTQLQCRTRDAIVERFGRRALDFWSGLATPEGGVVPALDCGDGVHLTDAGHRLLFERVLAADLPAAGVLPSPDERWAMEAKWRDSVFVRVPSADEVMWRWVDASGRLVHSGRATGPVFGAAPNVPLMPEPATLHVRGVNGGGGVVRVWPESTAGPRRAEHPDR